MSFRYTVTLETVDGPTAVNNVANGRTGERLADWTGSGSDLRFYGSNAHRDTTWLAGSSGTVSQSLRYDPWGSPRGGSVPSGYTPFRFQGSWFDDATSLSWVVTRWYAPALGRFISEDSLLGEPIDPPSPLWWARDLDNDLYKVRIVHTVFDIRVGFGLGKTERYIERK